MKTLRTILLVGIVVAATLVGYWGYTRELFVTSAFALFMVAAVTAILCAERHRSYHMMEHLLANLRMHDYSLAFREEDVRREGAWHQPDIDTLARNINHVVEQYKRHELEVHTQMRYYETLLGCIDTAIIVSTPDGIVEWCNRAATEQLLGYAPHHIDEIDKAGEGVAETLQRMVPGRTVQLLLHKGRPRETLMVADVSIYTTAGRTLRLYALRNIREVLEENEMLSWQKLIRVLTHEIMNSLAPIISLSETLEGYLTEETEEDETSTILHQGLHTIHRRSHGLLEFMKNYRKVALVTQPVCGDVKVSELVEPLKPLFPTTEHITYRFDLSLPDTVLHIDRTQMEQVLINLLKNATEACLHTTNAVVTLTDDIDTDSGRYRLHVTDNGSGILPEVQEKIFIPFFTTKPQGSGIGLALSKQIVHLHHGTLRVTSTEGCTCFTVELMPNR